MSLISFAQTSTYNVLEVDHKDFFATDTSFRNIGASGTVIVMLDKNLILFNLITDGSGRSNSGILKFSMGAFKGEFTTSDYSFDVLVYDGVSLQTGNTVEIKMMRSLSDSTLWFFTLKTATFVDLYTTRIQNQ